MASTSKRKHASTATLSLPGARWIGDRQRAGTGEPPCLYLIRDFVVAGPVRRATLRWTALGVADVFLNGAKIGTEILQPGWSDYRKRVQVITGDLTAALKPGGNTLGAILADGWYSGHLLWKNERNHYGKQPQFLAVLEIELTDGRKQTVKSDAAWQLGYGPLLGSDLYHGETHDARREDPQWCEPGAVRDRAFGWRAADVFTAYKGMLQPKINEPVRVTDTLPALAITEPQSGRYVFDFGQNLSGVCRLTIKGRSGQTITLRFAEMLQADGTLYVANLRLARATDTYTCRGGGVEEWSPRFTFHGFRYAEVTGLDGKPGLDLLQAQVLHSDLRATGEFTCSNPLLNQLNQNIRWGQRGNFLDVPTDCPQRDERLGWTGDAQVFVGTAAFHYDVRLFFRKWLRDLTDGQRADGAFPDIAPDVLFNFGNAAWADAGVICPWVIYQRYGDTEILRENYDAMARWIVYQEKTAADLVRPRTNYGDWLAIDAVTAPNAPVPCDLVGTAYFAYTTHLMAEIAALLGHRADAVRFRALHEKIVRAFRRAYVTPSGRVVGHCQTGYLLALAFDLLPVAQRPAALAHLVDLIASRDWHLTTGFIGTPLLCPVLTRFGRTDIAYRLLLQETYPSWLYPIKNGATTMWERWNSYTHENGFGPMGMNSFNHYAYGAIGEWMYKVIGGLRAEAPGYTSILFAPEPGGGVGSATIALEGPQGRIECAWRLKGKTLTLELLVPPQTKAKLRLPPGFASKARLAPGLTPGRHTIVCSRISSK